MTNKRKTLKAGGLPPTLKALVDRAAKSEGGRTFATREEMAELLASAKPFNSRFVGKPVHPLRFELTANGRLDSLTSCCGTMAMAEECYRFPFKIETDHLFLYTKQCKDEPSIFDGYALFIKNGKLMCFLADFHEGIGLVRRDIQDIDPKELLSWLNFSSSILKEDTVVEQMAWVREARTRGLLSPDYPAFVFGIMTEGKTMTGPWIALPLGAPLPLGYFQTKA